MNSFSRLHRAALLGVSALTLVGTLAACGSAPPLVQPGTVGNNAASANPAGSGAAKPAIGVGSNSDGGSAGLIGVSSAKAMSPLPAISSVNAAASPGGLTRGITVTGVGQVKVRPDQALVSTGVQTRAQTAKEAQTVNNQQMQAVLTAIKGLNIPDANIQTSGISLYPVTDQDRNVTGYNASNQVTVRVENIDEAGTVLDAAIKAGANQIGSVQFTLKNEAQARSQALTDATKDAQAKADTLAKALGVQVTGIEAVAEASTSGEYVGPRVAASAAAGSVPIEAGEITVTAQVTIVYGF